MRRLVILAAAFGYPASYLAVCLSACLMGPAVRDHGCCPTADGIGPAHSDCCSVTPGLSHDAAAVAPFALSPAVVTPRSPSARARSAAMVWPPRVAASPPLVLRV